MLCAPWSGGWGACAGGEDLGVPGDGSLATVPAGEASPGPPMTLVEAISHLACNENVPCGEWGLLVRPPWPHQVESVAPILAACGWLRLGRACLTWCRAGWEEALAQPQCIAAGSDPS